MTLPPVPPGLENFRLEAFLESLRIFCLTLDKRTSEVDGGDAGTDQDSASGFEPIYESPVVLAGVGETEDTEDAWTTLASGAPTGARYAIIQFYLFSDDDDADVNASWRMTDSTSVAVQAAVIRSDETDAEGQTRLPWYFIPLNDAGQFDYIVNTVAGTVDWEIRRIGYVL